MNQNISENKDSEEEEDFDFLLHKKKKKNNIPSTSKSNTELPAKEFNAETNTELPTTEEEKDYTYAELLERLYTQLNMSKKPVEAQNRISLTPPQVSKFGSKKTIFINFATLTKQLQRNNAHFSKFIFDELATTGSIDSQERLLLKGKFTSAHIETVIRKYLREFVICNNCKSMRTTLDKDNANKLLFLICQNCGAKRSRCTKKTNDNLSMK
jgi:translation initiation factor 2 subunit 2